MKIKHTKNFPFGKFTSINLYGVLFTKSKRLSARTKNHELIHEYQALDLCGWKPLGYTLYYILYFIFWIIELIRPPYDKAYHDSCFEKEAYMNDQNLDYLKARKRFACFKKMYWKNYIYPRKKK